MLLITIWPIFALICLGHVLSRRGVPSADFWPAAERLNYFVLFPALLISGLADAPVRDPQVLRLGAAAMATILFAAGCVTALRRLRPMPAARFGPVLQGVIRFNTYLALAVVTMLAGSEGVERAAIYLAVAVPLVNVLAIQALRTPGDGHGALSLLKSVFRNPLILACLFGFALAVTGIGTPLGTGALLTLMGQGSLPLGLLCVGAALQPTALRADIAGLGTNGFARLLLMPALAALSARLFGLSGVETLVLVVFSAVPTAPSAYILTRQMNGDGPFMAGLVTSQTLAAILTIPLVLLVLTTR
ncbi:auxin Efflux Carrier [Oceaniovalibus guishaninsula JLT2003]|uniref:Auxin Efflux Carrier n=1 Tax=Oceaniovalibus guishaninsula JLT2003 TaxID=1231392 RepID=K2HM76_9RHOB|nr:AEC family transporter [Oceaniovalibus guishaninsula]EKE43984.1 auxin Efflux Carrier [Oceaniovalibus guishaninsula JLT2003]